MTSRSEDLKTPIARLAYSQYLFSPQEKKNMKGEITSRQYNCTLLFAKTADITTLHNAAIEAATKEWGDKAVQWIKDGVIKSPFLDGDGKQAISKKTGDRHEGFAGHTFLRVTSGEKFQPKVFAKDAVNRITDANYPDGLYSGSFGYAVVHAYTWENAENGKGLTFGVSLVQKAKEGERLGGGGGADPDKFLQAIPDEGAAPAETKGGAGAGGLFA